MKFNCLIILFFGLFWSCNHPESKEYERSLSTTSTILSESNEVNNESKFQVYKVIDGDTFYCVDEQNIEYKVRLIGVDTPEIRNYGKKQKGYYGKEAKDFLTDLLLNKTVFLEFDLDKYDQYNRMLAYVYLEDNTFVNAELVKNGFARIMTIQPNSKYADTFYKLQQEARENKTGLWEVEQF